MSYRPRQCFDSAVEELRAEARHCAHCGDLYVYGRKGNTFCSESCARAAAQRRYRTRAKREHESGHRAP